MTQSQTFLPRTLFGIPIYAHYSWLPVFPFYAWAIASGLLPREAPGLSIVQYWALGFLTSILLFVSVLARARSRDDGEG